MSLEEKYKTEIISKLKNELKIKNPMQVPKLLKIVVNLGVKDALSDKKNLEKSALALSLITGQKPKTTKAKKSIASFKLREGDQIGLMVTLRGKRMYEFLEKIINVVLPRLKDFHGISKESFDNRGNYTLGFFEYSVFPEIDLGKFEKIQGLETTIVSSSKNKEEGHALLKELGMPFKKN